MDYTIMGMEIFTITSNFKKPLNKTVFIQWVGSCQCRYRIPVPHAAIGNLNSQLLRKAIWHKLKYRNLKTSSEPLILLWELSGRVVIRNVENTLHKKILFASSFLKSSCQERSNPHVWLKERVYYKLVNICVGYCTGVHISVY
jgi:hypothetical protein